MAKKIIGIVGEMGSGKDTFCDYVKENYITTEYQTLYDGYKPKYSYVCSCCSTEFSRDKKLKTDVVFCSRTCAGKGHKGRVKVSIDYVG